MKIFRENIAKAENYEQNGEEKTKWHTVGSITTFIKDDGTQSKLLEIPLLGLKASVFPWKPKTENVEGAPPVQGVGGYNGPTNQDGTIDLEPQIDITEDISLDDIDFEN